MKTFNILEKFLTEVNLCLSFIHGVKTCEVPNDWIVVPSLINEFPPNISNISPWAEKVIKELVVLEGLSVSQPLSKGYTSAKAHFLNHYAYYYTNFCKINSHYIIMLFDYVVSLGEHLTDTNGVISDRMYNNLQPMFTKMIREQIENNDYQAVMHFNLEPEDEVVA